MRKVFLLILLAMVSVMASAQGAKLTGTLVDRDTREPLTQATVQLLKTDSTFITGAISDNNGRFSFTTSASGRFLLKITIIGYQTTYRRILIPTGRDLSVGTIALGTDAVMLKGATVTGQATKVVLKEDTFIYNASAYRTPEGSTVEELVKRLPGAEVGDDGKITINGKEVKKILIDGKEFMTGDTKTALKNLPTSIIDKIKTYDQRSDLSRVTGIDDGEEQTVLDFGIKEGMNKGLFGNADLSAGNHGRYAERLMGAYFNSKWRVMLFGGANNTNDMGFPGGGGRGRFGGGRQGLNASKMVGVNMNYDDGQRLKIDGSLRWNHSDGDVRTQSAVENFVSRVGAYSNSIGQRYTRGNSWDGRMRVEWRPDTLTNIMFRPSFTVSQDDGIALNRSATFMLDPYQYVTDPLSTSSIAQLVADSLVVNTRNNSGITYRDVRRTAAMLQYNRRLGNNGRNFTLRVDGSYGETQADNLSLTNVHLYRLRNVLGQDSTYQTNRYSLAPVKNWSYSAQATYSEPLWRAIFLQFSYKFKYSYSKSDRQTYDFSPLGENFFAALSPAYRGWDSYIGRLTHPLANYSDEALSRYSEYKNYTNELELMLRIIRSAYKFNIGVMLQPQKSHFMQHYQGVNTDTTRTVTNFSPTLDFRYRFSKVSNLRINYRGTTTQPSMTDLLDITDDSDPLNILRGNPGLKPSFTNNFRLFYNNYVQGRQRSIMIFLDYNNTRNSISNRVTYDETTGGRVSRPENINGNWSAAGAFMFNTAIDSTGYWNVSTFTNAHYNHYVSYLSPNRSTSSVKSATRSLSLGERLGGSYRNSWLELELDGSFNYTHSRNRLQSVNNLDTWQFAYGATLNLTAPWGMSLSTDLHQNSRRGYSDHAMNTDELVWNAQLAQSFLKGRPLTVSLQFYDILHNQSNLSRTINALQRSDTSYNSINSYVMLHVIYRLNLFGTRDSRRGMRGSDDRPRFGNPDTRGHRPLGAPGGGRPPFMH